MPASKVNQKKATPANSTNPYTAHNNDSSDDDGGDILKAVGRIQTPVTKFLQSRKNPYLEAREAEKMAGYQTILMILKSSIGILFLSLPFYFSKTGYILGTLIIMLASSASYYGTYTALDIAEKIEDANSLVEIESFEGLGWWCTLTDSRKYLEWAIKVPLFFTVMAATIADVCQFGILLGG
jgi:hypothetical protein